MKKINFIFYITLTIFVLFIYNLQTSSAADTKDNSSQNKIKVCKDISCEDPGIIDFNKTSDGVLSLDKENNVIGKVWGNELGWVTFNPPYGGVFIADVETGLLKGTAWSETSGAINFAVTGQKVTINPSTQEWSGYAFASGPYGGWIKFNCKEGSCLKTNLQKEGAKILPKEATTKKITEKENIDFVEIFNGTGTIFAELFNDFYFNFENLYDGLKFLTKNTTKIVSSSFTNLNDGTIFLIKNTREIMSESFSNLNASTLEGYDILYKYSIEIRNSIFK